MKNNKDAQTFRFTVANDADWQAALKHLRDLTKLHNEVEKTRATKEKTYTPRLERLTTIGRIGRNLLVGPRYRVKPAGPQDTSQEKHTAPLETARTIDVYITI
jgi:hypothetical protein